MSETIAWKKLFGCLIRLDTENGYFSGRLMESPEKLPDGEAQGVLVDMAKEEFDSLGWLMRATYGIHGAFDVKEVKSARLLVPTETIEAAADGAVIFSVCSERGLWWCAYINTAEGQIIKTLSGYRDRVCAQQALVTACKAHNLRYRIVHTLEPKDVPGVA
jgi:hypothetical protein